MKHVGTSLTWSLLAVLAAHPARAAAPDFSGVWQIVTPVISLTTTAGTEPPLLPAAKAIHDKYAAQRAAGDLSFDPAQKCKPLGEPRVLLQPEAFKIVQNAKQVWFFYQWNNLVRWVNLNTKPDPDAFTTYFGSNTGTFVGNTLVVHAQLFNDFTFLDDSGLPHSDALVMTEKYHLADGGQHLVADITFDDPKIFSAPWQTELTFRKLPTDRIGLDVCEDRIDTSKFY